MNQNELIAAVKTMIEAPSCCQELQAVGKKYLDAVGTAGEKAAFDALLAEVKADICTLEHTIPFFESETAVGIFGAERAKALAVHARERQANGEKWCDCPACAAGVKILTLAGVPV
ncbi:MAG: heat-shock protein Hsp90 [Lentisphaeria bacterium]|nr:heat-shock protein Hsp90 [Lentisphaeria bacterium]